jgi:CheY-like chemotaxis protein/anti-sigma regulatory factor (Ser/Thr protein kinase)
LGYLELYQQEKQAQQLRQVAASAKQLHVLINEMHDFSKWSNDNIKIEQTTAYLPATIDTVITPYQLVADRKGLSLTVHIAQGCEQDVQCDHQHFAWVLSQLVDNAIKFSEQGEIQVSAQIHNESQQAILVVSVKDQGQGFSDEILQTLSSGSEEDNHFQGMQLGLTRCQLVINALSGQMEVSNDSTGGAQVVISIPIEFAANAKPEASMTVAGKMALLVEDNAVNAIVIKKLLHDIGFTVEHAEHGQAALDILQQHNFDVIFMDLNMPYMDGYEAIEKIRTQLMLQTTVIIVTANNEEQDLDKAMALGGNGYIIKPLTAPAIKQALLKLGVTVHRDKTHTS